jgi:hypothetical protein
MTTTLFTIGFTRKSAEEFFTRLQKANVRRVLDIRLNNTNQLAGFAKRDDLRYFLMAIGGIEYKHLPELAPPYARDPGRVQEKGRRMGPLRKGVPGSAERAQGSRTDPSGRLRVGLPPVAAGRG